MFLAYQMRWFAFLGGGSDDDDGGGILGLLVMAILAPIAAVLIQMAISRSREYKDDAGAAALTHNSEGLASGLEKLGRYTRRIPMRATNQTAHLFIVSPLSGKSLSGIFSTHPPLEERVNRLRRMR
jgi:heat shock protein HtpX